MADTFWTWNAHMHVPTKLQTVFRTHTTLQTSRTRRSPTGSQTDCTGTRQRLRAERYPDAIGRTRTVTHPHGPLPSPARHAVRLDKASSSYPSTEPDDDAHAPSPSSPTMITWWRRRRDRSASRASKMRPTVWIATTARRDEDRRSIGDRR